MAVVRSDLINQSGSANEDTSREFEFVYRVQTNDRSDLATTVTAGFPALFSSLGVMWPGALLVSIVPEQDDANPFIWLVTLTYKTLNFGQAGGANTAHSNPGERQENPTARRPVVSYATQKYQKAAVKGLKPGAQPPDFSPIVNSAGDHYEAAEIDDSRMVLTIQRNETTGQYDPVYLNTFHDTVNSKVFYDFDPGEVKFDSFKATSQHENGVTFWEVTYEFHVRQNYVIANGGVEEVETVPGQEPEVRDIDLSVNGWDLVLPDAGYAEFPLGGERTEFTDKDTGNVVSSPLPLNGFGRKLQKGQLEKWNVWQVYEWADFTELNLE